MTLTTTAGSSMPHMKLMASCLRLTPGEEEEVMARAPVMAAPMIMLIEAVSLSPWIKVPPTWGSRRAMCSGSSFWGVMG